MEGAAIPTRRATPRSVSALSSPASPIIWLAAVMISARSRLLSAADLARALVTSSTFSGCWRAEQGRRSR
jgi:hypothetical protein